MTCFMEHLKTISTSALASVDIAFKCSIKHDIACSEVPYLYNMI